MSQLNDGYEEWLDWLDEEGFIPLNGVAGEYYECPGNHIWHVDSVEKLYRKQKAGKEAEHILNGK